MARRLTRREIVYRRRARRELSIRDILYRKRAITRKPKTRRIDIVSRRGQPQITAVVKQIKKREGLGGPVSSSWISEIWWYDKWASMVLLNGYSYNVYIPFEIFEEWYYAHSKGTYFNGNIKDKYKVVRAA